MGSSSVSVDHKSFQEVVDKSLAVAVSKVDDLLSPILLAMKTL